MAMLICFYLVLSHTASQLAHQTLQQFYALTTLKGDCVTLSCLYQEPYLERFTVKWYFLSDTLNSTENIATLSSESSLVNNSHYAVGHAVTNKRFTLQIKDVQVSDRGEYYCRLLVTLPPPTVTKMGTRTRLNVTARPSLRIFPSVPMENSSSRWVSVSCLASGFYPESIEMRFHSTCLAHRLTKWTLSTLTRNSDRTYNITAGVCVPTVNCTEGAHITCTVRHPALQSEINQTEFIIPPHKDNNRYPWIYIWISVSILVGYGVTGFVVLVVKHRRAQRQPGGINRSQEDDWENICYAQLDLQNLGRIKRREEEIVYSQVLR